MACPRCTFRLLRRLNSSPTYQTTHRTFTTTPSRQRLGAFTYPQEWTHTTYNFNKALSKTLPVAQTHTDRLLSIYATQQKRNIDPSNPLYKQITRTNIAAQRRMADRVFISKSTAKDKGDRVEVTAFVYDGVGAAEAEKERLRKKRMGVKEGEGAQGGERRRPAGRRRVGGGTESAGGDGGSSPFGGAARGPSRAGNAGAGSARPGPGRFGGGGGSRGPPRGSGAPSSGGSRSS